MVRKLHVVGHGTERAEGKLVPGAGPVESALDVGTTELLQRIVVLRSREQEPSREHMTTECPLSGLREADVGDTVGLQVLFVWWVVVVLLRK